MYCWFILTVFSIGWISAEEVRLLDLPPEEAQQYIEKQDQTLKYAPKIDSNVPAVRVLGDTPTNVLEDIYLANQHHGQDGLGGYLYGYSVPDIAKSEKKKAHGDLRGAYQYINGGGQEIKVQYWDDGSGFHQVDNLPEVLPKQVEDSPDVQAAKQEFFKRWHEEAERNSQPISANSPPGGTLQSDHQQYQPEYSVGGGQAGQSYSGQYQPGQSGHPLVSSQQGSGIYQSGSGQSQSNQPQYQPGDFQHQSSQGQYSLGGYQPGASQTSSSQTGQYQSGQNQPGSQYSLSGYQPGASQTSSNQTGQYQPGSQYSSGGYQSGQTQLGGGQQLISQNQPSEHQGTPGQGTQLSQGGSQTDSGVIGAGQGGYILGQGSQQQPQYHSVPHQAGVGYQTDQSQFSSASLGQTQPTQAGQGNHATGISGSSSGQVGYQSGQGCCGNGESGGHSGQYSNDQGGGGNEWEYKPTEEEKGPPRGFFYNFDYPVGIIVQKQGEGGSVHKRDSLEHLYKENKANYEIQVRNGASPDGSSQGGYQVHL